MHTDWVDGVQDEYHALSYKTMALWRLVEDHFDIDYLIKVDDDNFVRLDRLSIATHQWDEENAGLQPSHAWRCCLAMHANPYPAIAASGGYATAMPAYCAEGH